MPPIPLLSGRYDADGELSEDGHRVEIQIFISARYVGAMIIWMYWSLIDPMFSAETSESSDWEA